MLKYIFIHYSRFDTVLSSAKKEKQLQSGAKPTGGFLLPSAAPCSKTDINSTPAAMGANQYRSYLKIKILVQNQGGAEF
jgi:hypothetical protein